MAVIIPGNSSLFKYFPLRFNREANASQISYLELLAKTPNPGSLSYSVEIFRYI